jgi:hypothetical protein
VSGGGVSHPRMALRTVPHVLILVGDAPGDPSTPKNVEQPMFRRGGRSGLISCAPPRRLYPHEMSFAAQGHRCGSSSEDDGHERTDSNLITDYRNVNAPPRDLRSN